MFVYCILAIGSYTNHIHIQTANTKLNYAHRQTNKTYKQQNTQTNKTYQQTTNNKQKESGPNSHTEKMRNVVVDDDKVICVGQ